MPPVRHIRTRHRPGNGAAPRAASRFSILVPTAGLTSVLLVTALASTPAQYQGSDIVLLFLVYATLALTLHTTTLYLNAISRLLAAGASLVVGAVLTVHLREQLRVPSSKVEFVATALLLAALYAFVVWASRPHSAKIAGRWPLIGCLALVALTVGGYTLDDTFRLHLLRHNRILGTPSYYLLAEPVEVLKRDLWRQAPSQAQSAAPTSAPSLKASAAPGRDLVFILVDTLRADGLSVYGGDPKQMPFTNSWASQSLVFSDTIANTSWTRPSVGSFFTGLPQEEHGAVDREDRLPDDRQTLAESLSELGYETAAFVSNFGAVGRAAGFDQGFREFYELDARPAPYARAAEVNRSVLNWLDRKISDRSSPRQPLFLYVHYLDPHAPYLSGGPQPRGRDLGRVAYEKELQYLDGHLHELVTALRSKLARPAILFTSDHGEEFGEHGEAGHGHALYHEGIRIPTVVSLDDRQGISPAKLEARDFFYLLLGLANNPALDAEAWAAGREHRQRYTSSYLSTSMGWHRPYLQRVCTRAVEEDDWILIWSAYGNTWELYDLRSDPKERVNLADMEPDKRAHMTSLLANSVTHWAKRVQAAPSGMTSEQLRALGYL